MLQQQTASYFSSRNRLFGINKELQFKICNHGQPCASPQQENGQKSFMEGKRKLGVLQLTENPWLFIGRVVTVSHWISCDQARRGSLSSSCQVLLSTQGMRAPFSDLSTLFKLRFPSTHFYSFHACKMCSLDWVPPRCVSSKDILYFQLCVNSPPVP